MDFFQLMSSYLCPPGEGVYTVNTAKERKAELHQALYGETGSKVRELWLKQISEAKWDIGPLLLGVASDCGGGIQRGANWGPLRLRNAFQAAKEFPTVLDIGDIRVIPHLLHDKYLNQETLKECRLALYNNDNGQPVSPLSLTEEVCRLIYKQHPKAQIFALGGDHSVSYPLVKAFLETHQESKDEIGILHFDAHTDLLDKRLGIDLCFGSWTYHILPYLQAPENVVQIGIRSSGKDRSHWESTNKVKQIWSYEVKKHGLEKTVEETLMHFKARNVKKLYCSFDIDAIDSQYAGATGTPEPDGLSPHEACYIIEEIGKKIEIVSGDMVEVAPFVNFNESREEPQSTLETATILSQKILEAMIGAS